MSLSTIPHDLRQLSDEALLDLANDVILQTKADRQEWQLLYYKPNSANALKIHLSTAHLIGIGGGNRSGKTDTNLAEAAIQATGIIPESLKGIYPREKLRGPITVRVVCESHTTTLAPVILHKLNYSNWSGVDSQGGERGHWGWIPKACLIEESWEKSWKESKRQLQMYCRDPDDPDKILGISTWQFMSHDQLPKKFASGEFHLIVIDEPPSHAIFTENLMRGASVDGRLMLGMTWPDDPSIPVDWIFDEIYDVGQEGPKKRADVEWIELVTTDNPNIDQKAIARVSAGLSDLERACRIGGKPIRFSNRVHPLFTDTDSWWCFTCNEEVLAYQNICTTCGNQDVELYNHVQDFVIDPRWPTIFVLDPHPRKPHMFMYVQVDGNDDYSVVMAGELADEPDELAIMTHKIERELELTVAKRLIDPNMGASPSGKRREVSWRDEFASAGLHCDLAEDSSVGRGRINEYLKPDRQTRQPRLRFHDGNCGMAIYQMKRYVWDDFRYQDNKDQKQVPRPKYDDYPAMLKYLMNDMPLHSVLKFGGTIIKPAGKLNRGY